MINKFRLPSYEELEQANAIGLSNKTIRSRLDYGWETDRALTTPLNPNRVPQELKDQLNKMGISLSTYWGRLHKGWPKEKASTTPLTLQKPVHTKEELARMRASKIDRRTIAARLRRGWDFERALTEPAKKIGRGATRD